MIPHIKTHGFPGLGRTGFGRDEIYPDITSLVSDSETNLDMLDTKAMWDEPNARSNYHLGMVLSIYIYICL